MATLLSNSPSVIWASMSDHQEQKMSSASAEYPPFSLVILVWCILQNSFNALAAAAANTSAAIVAESWGLLTIGATGLTSKVLSLGILPATWYGMEVYVGMLGIMGMLDTLGVLTVAVWWDIPPCDPTSGLSLGLLELSSNLTCLWNEKAWSWELYWAASLHELTVPGSMLNTSSHKPDHCKMYPQKVK